MKYTKKPLSIPEQVQKLKQRGLIINDEQFAEKTLAQISYYRLRAYTYPFQDNKSPDSPFIETVTFESIIDLYRFDQKLRVLIFDAIEKIEIALRTQIIYHFSLQHGSHWQTDPHLYRDTSRFAKHLESLNREIERSDETFIKHYKKKYHEPSQPPSWMSLEVASMGTLSKLYQNVKDGDAKRTVADNFGLIKIGNLENWMFCFSSARNICAHHGRLWNRRLSSIIRLPYTTKNAFLNKKEVKAIYTNKLYATLLAMSYVLKIVAPSFKFDDKLKQLMTECPLNQQKAMGFTENWQDHPFWN